MGESMKILSFIVMFLGIVAVSATDLIVDKGKPTELAVYQRQGWRSENNLLCGGGEGNNLRALYSYQPDGLTVDLDFSIAELNATAAGIGLGDMLFGFDGGKAANLFTEDAKGITAVIGSTRDHIKPGERFLAQIRCKQGKAEFFLNGKPVGSIACGIQPVSVYLRPWRNRVAVHSFAVNGQRVGVADTHVSAVGKILDCRNDATFELSPPVIFTGNCEATLSSLENSGVSESFTTEVSADGVIRIPRSIMERIYQKNVGKYVTTALRLVLRSGKKVYSCNIVLSDSRRPRDFALGEVRHTSAGNRFFVNGKSLGMQTGLLTVCNGTVNAKGAERFGKIGIHGKLMLLRPRLCFKNGKFDAKAFAAKVESYAAQMISSDPDSLLMLQFELFMPTEWGEKHPDELIVLDNGVDYLANAPSHKRQPSYASELWRKEAAEMVSSALAELRKSPIADRIFYFKLLYANCGEWNHWGYQEKAFVDCSRPMNIAFGAWLKKKYKTEEALRRAWQKTSVSFLSPDLVPGRKERLAGGPIFRGASGPARQSADYYNFFQEYAAGTIEHFAHFAKKASSRRLLVGAYYGYYFGHYGSNYHFQDSGHYGIRYLLRSPDIDFFGGPDVYSERRSVSPLNGLTASVELAGKVWEAENDYRTHHALGPRHRELGATDNLEQTLELLKRNFIITLGNRNCYYFFDFAKDWYKDEESMNLIADLQKIDQVMEKMPYAKANRIAVLFSESVVAQYTSRFDNGIYNAGRMAGRELPFLGIPYDRYLLEDISRIDFSVYQAVIFFNTFQVTEEQAREIQKKVAGNNRTLIWLYAPGCIAPDGSLQPEKSVNLTGIGLRLEENRDYGKLIFRNKTRPYKKGYPTRTVIDDAAASILAYHADGAPAAAEKIFPDYRSVVICSPAPSVVFLRQVLQGGRVFSYTSGVGSLDQTAFAWPLLGAYRAGKPIMKKIWFGKNVEVVADPLTGKILAENVNMINLNYEKTYQTKLLYAGSRADYEKCIAPAMNRRKK